MSESSVLHAELVVRRGAPGEAPRYETWRVPYEEGQTVLDALRWIRVNADPTLALRYSCINANACKECMMQVDGKAEYACLARLAPRVIRVEPLAKKTLVHDLMTEIAPTDERL
jgi:succinate dehydrogenase/fumarate reductase-like Fe-S protein